MSGMREKAERRKMNNKEILDILDNAKDESGAVPMRLVRQAFDKLTNAQPEQKWIPCSERLPENNRQVLVFARSVHFALAKYDEMREADGTYKKQWVTFDAWKPFYTIKNVIAWMPLPEHYQAEERKYGENHE